MAYNKTIWENKPSTNSPVNANNMNKIEQGIYDSSLGVEKIGDITLLDTTDKTSVVNAINEVNGNLPKITSLWTGSKSTTGDITLSEAYTNYDFLLVGIQADSYSKGSELIPTSDIVQSSSGSNTYEITTFQSASVYSNMSIQFKNTTTLNIIEIHRAGWNGCILKYVIGIKL